MTAADWRKFVQAGRNAIALATVLGWNVYWNSSAKNTAVLTNRNGTKKIVVPTTNINAHRAVGWLNQIFTNSDTDQVINLARGNLDLMTQPEDVQRVVATMGTALNEFARTYAEARHLIEKEGNAVKAAPLTQKIMDAVAPVPPKPAPPVEPEPVTGSHTTQVVKVEPLQATRFTGHGGNRSTRYISKAIEVVTLDDGTEFFRCQFCKKYVNANKLSVRSHVNSVHRGEGSPDHKKEETPVTPPPPAAPAAQGPSLHGIELLTHEVREALRPNNQPRDVSVHLLNLSFEQRAKIAHIILNGKDVETLRTVAEEAVSEAKAAAAAAEAKAAAATERANQIESDLTALREMVQGIGSPR